MATGGSRFEDQEYVNWIRTTLGMMYMKEGLEKFTDDQVLQFHNELCTSFGSTARLCSCNSRDIKKDHRNKKWTMTCPDCNIWLQEAIRNHRNAPFPLMSPVNTDPQLWRTEPWETAKLFLPHGCKTDTCAKDMDIQGMLTLFVNCQHFSRGKHIGRQDLLDALLGIRNDMFHSGNFKVNAADTRDILQTILSFLQDMTGLRGTVKETLQAATDRVIELKTNVIELAMNKELELRALQQQQIAIDRDLRSLADGIQKEQDSQNTELKKLQSRFDEFLQVNDLVGDMANLSKRVTDIDLRLHTVEDILKLQPKGDTGGVIDAQATCEGIKQLLLQMYGKRKFWKDPVTADEALLAQMYVPPSVKHIREIDEQGRMTSVQQQETKLTYTTIFKSKSGLSENIYLTGEAGSGKTTFCNQLVLQWCNAVQNNLDNTLSTEDLNHLSTFQFLFYINLRNSEAMYRVEDMIQEQLLFNAPESLKSGLFDILKTKKCLIVLDGLDEWSCPDDVKKCPDINKNIPGRNTANNKCVYLTTSRGWKYHVIALENKDVDKHIAISGIDEDSSDKLAQKMLNYLDRNSETNKTVADFYKDVHKKNINAFLTVPVLLIQLVSLWFYGKDFGNSQLQLYCSMLELLFECSAKNLHDEILQCTSKYVANAKKLPDCFITKDYCQQYAELLLCLAELAYKSLFNKQKEQALVFKSSQMEILGISPSDIKLCLHCGILSQCKDYGNYEGKYKKLSFFHKKIQECLAALFIVSNDNAEEILKDVKQFCNSVKTMLEMNQVWLFVAGMDPDKTRRLFEHLADVVSADEQANNYRQTLDPDYAYDGVIDDIQKLVTNCVSEGVNNGQQYNDVCLEDFHIEFGNVRDIDRLTFYTDMSKVKLLFIETDDIDAAKLAVITSRFQRCRSLKKLFLDDLSSHIPVRTVADLVDSNCDSLISLCLSTNITTTDKLVTAICTSISKSLMSLELSRVKLTHKHKEQLLNSLSQSPVIRQLELHGLLCTDHDNKCRARIDLSAMTQLQKLVLRHYMHADNIQYLPNCIEKVELWSISLPVTSLRDFALGLSQTGRKMTVVLDMVTFSETREVCGDLKGFLRKCSGLQLTQCKYFTLNSVWAIKFHTCSQ